MAHELEGKVRLIYFGKEPNCFATDCGFPVCHVRAEFYTKKRAKQDVDKLGIAHSDWMTINEAYKLIHESGRGGFSPLVDTCEGLIFNTFKSRLGMNMIGQEYITFDEPIQLR